VIIIHNDERIRELVADLDEVQEVIDKLIWEEEDLDTAVEHMDTRVFLSECLHLAVKEALENQE